MPLETGSFVNDLVTTNPPASDPVGQGDDHIRLIKSVLQNTLPRSNSALGKGFSQDVSGSITALQAYQHVLVTNSATATVQFSIPPSSSITNGWSFRVSTDAGVFVILNRLGADVINGGTSFTIPPESVGELNYLGSAVFRASYRPAGIGGRVLFSNPVQFNSTITVSGAAQFGSTVTISGAAVTGGPMTVGGTLTVSGAAVTGGPLTVGGTLTVSGAATLGVVGTGALTVNGPTTLSGAAAINGALTVNGATTLSGAATFKGVMSVSGAATFGGTMTVSAATVLQSTLAVRAAATFDTTVTISGALTLNSTLTVSGASVFGTVNTGALTVNGTGTISGDAIVKGNVSISGAMVLGGALTVSAGQIIFPAAQNASAGANTLDDYEEGTWTPVFTFSTPGDVAVTVVTQVGHYTKVGNTVNLWCQFAASVITHTTSAGAMQITGLPFNVAITTACPCLGGVFDNISMTDFSGLYFQPITGGSLMNISVSNLNGGASAALTTGAHVSGTGLSATGHICYRV